MNTEHNENKMGIMPIPKLMITMSLPAIIAMMVQALYNVVDSIFVSRINVDALTALSLAFPIQMIIISFSVGLGVGINSLISRKLGAKEHKAASNTAEHGIGLCLILYIIILILALIWADDFFYLFSKSQAVIDYGTQYIRIIMIFSFGRLFSHAVMSILQGTGDMVIPMVSQLIGAVLNIIFDPIFIFTFDLGVKGAAIATVLSQIISMIFIMIILFTKEHIVTLDMRNFKIDKKIIKGILAVGFPAAVMQGLASAMLMGLNWILAGLTEAAVTVLGVYFKLQSFIFMPVFGLSQGALPVIGYNYGAKNRKRMMKTIKTGILVAVFYMTLGLIVFQIFPLQLLGLFKSTNEMLDIGINAFRIISISFPLAAVSIICSVSFQAMGKAYISMIASFIRQIIVLLPAAYILGNLFGVDIIWYSFTISETACIIVILSAFRSVYKKNLAHWE